MWSEEGYEYPKGYTFSDIMSADPELTWSDIRLEKSIVTVDEKSVNFFIDINFSWHNFNRRKWIDWLIKYSGYRTITSFKYSTWVSINGNVEQIANEKVLDVASVSAPAPEADFGEEFITTSSTTYSDTLTIDLSKYSGSNINIDYVEFHITPFGLKEGGDNNDDLEKFKVKQKYKILVNQSGQKLKIVKVDTTSPIINAVSTMNPLYDASGTGSPRYLVYNHPNATVALSLSSAKKIVSKNSKILYTANLASVGAASSPVPSTYNLGDLSYSGSCCKSSCVKGKDSHIQLVYDNNKHKEFLFNKLASKSYCVSSRSRHQLLASIDENQTTFEKYIQYGSDLDSTSTTLKTWIYHLRDFEEVAYNNEKITSGTVLRIKNSAFYALKNELVAYPEYILMGYAPIGPPFNFKLTTQKGEDYLKSYNTLDYQVVPEVSIPDLPADATEKKYICYSTDINDVNDVLILRGNQISCFGYASSIYSPDYRWDISVDGGKTWNAITDKEYSRYFLSYDMLPFPTNTNEETDLILRSSILSLGRELKFRQTCVLKSFSSTIPNNLYTHYEGGLYYIKLTGNNHYTYSYYASINDDNFAFDETSAPSTQYVCDGYTPINDISFSFIKSNSLSADMYNMLSKIVNYEVVKVENQEEIVVSSAPKYTINYTGDTLHYKCRIMACKDTISKDVWIYPLEKDSINLENISSSGQIREIDKENSIVHIMVGRGKNIDITINDDQLNKTDFFIREVSEYIEPNIDVLDFSQMSWIDMVNFAEANCSYTGCLSNYRQFGEDQLRSICYTIQETKNKKILDEAKQEYIDANAWKLFTKENSTTFRTKSDTLTSDMFYIKKQNRTFGCFSDSVRVNVYYFEGIKNNIISFSAAEDAEKDLIYVPIGSKNPTISGMLVEGGYGDPDTLSNISSSYEYQYISRPIGGVWQTLSTPFIDNGQHVTPSKTNLAAGRATIDRNIEIARVVYSRLNNNILTQVSDTSNILRIYVEYPISASEVKIKRQNTCPDTEIKVFIDDNFSNAERQNIQYFWSASDLDLTLSLSEIGNKMCTINGAKEDFVLSVYRYNSRQDSYTESFDIEIPVSEIEADFRLLTEQGVEVKLLETPTKMIEFSQGDKISLVNKSVGADEYLWTLQLQYFLGYEVEGSQTSLAEPSCYLYNPGINKLKLTAINEDGCKQTAVAENIYVNELDFVDERRVSAFATEDGQYPTKVLDGNIINVYPTIISEDHEIINVHSNEDIVEYSIFTTKGTLLQSGTDSYSFKIKLPYMQEGMYILKLNDKYIKLIRL